MSRSHALFRAPYLRRGTSRFLSTITQKFGALPLRSDPLRANYADRLSAAAENRTRSERNYAIGVSCEFYLFILGERSSQTGARYVPRQWVCGAK